MNSPRQSNMTNVFQNTRNSTPGAPQFTARDLTLDGIEGTFEVAMWGPKKARNGAEFYTIKIKPLRQQQAPPQAPAPAPAPTGYSSSSSYVGGDDDDIPF